MITHRILINLTSFVIAFAWTFRIFNETESSIYVYPWKYVTIFSAVERSQLVVSRRPDEFYFFLQGRPVMGSFVWAKGEFAM